MLTRTNQDQMELPRPPLLHGLLAIICKVIFDLFLFHERRKNSLIDRIVYRTIPSVTDITLARKKSLTDRQQSTR